MPVPSFWNPIRIWLHGETMPSPRGEQPKGVSDTYYQGETDRCDGYSFEWRRVKSAWYRQWVDLPMGIRGKRVTLTFDAVSKIGEVYVAYPADDPWAPLRQVIGTFPEDFMNDREQPSWEEIPEREAL